MLSVTIIISPLTPVTDRKQLTDEGDGAADDALGDLLDLDGVDVVDLTGERAAGDGCAAKRHVDAVLASQPRAKLHRQAAVAVVFDLRRHRRPVGAWVSSRVGSGHAEVVIGSRSVSAPRRAAPL